MKLFLTSAVAAVLVSISAYAETPVTAPPRTIEVTGHGEANAKPDTMVISITVRTQEPTIGKCLGAQAAKSQKVVESLKELLGPEAKIETSNFQQSYGPANPPPEPSSPTKQWVFKANVNARTDSMAKIGPIIEAATAAGASNVASSGMGYDTVATDGWTSFFGRHHKGPSQRVERPFVNLEVMVQGSTPSEVTSQGSETAGRVVKAVKDKVGANGRVAVTDMNVGKIPPELLRYQPAPPLPQMYFAQVTITAETQKMDLLGRAIRGVVDAGTTEINSVAFSLHDDEPVRRSALVKASEDSRGRAEAIATSMHVKLKNVLRITSVVRAQPQVFNGSALAASMQGGNTSESMAVRPREISFGADITAVYEIQ